MGDTVIRVENLSKKYVLSRQQGKNDNHKTARDAISSGAESLLRFNWYGKWSSSVRPVFK